MEIILNVTIKSQLINFLDKSMHYVKITLAQKKLYQDSNLNKLLDFHYRSCNNVIYTV